VYQWKPRTTFSIDPQVAGEALEKVRGHNSGELTPEAVVQSAKPKSSPLHALFEWDDKKAGQEYRLQQAGILIRSIVVTITGGGTPASEPMKITVRKGPRSGGATTAKVISQEELQRQRVERGWKELEEWRSQFGVLPEFAAVAAMIDGLLAARSKEAAAA
jgi:hypothetical protein